MLLFIDLVAVILHGPVVFRIVVPLLHNDSWNTDNGVVIVLLLGFFFLVF